tara:strand:- start:1199 stop:1726 length:528 start_codon:yes stop_codon:yes gene_type:complete
MTTITFNDNEKKAEIKFIENELKKLFIEYDKNFEKSIENIQQDKNFDSEIKKMERINSSINKLVEQVKKMSFTNVNFENNTLFSQINNSINQNVENLNKERDKINTMTQEVKYLVNKNKDEKLNNKIINVKYFLTAAFAIIIIFLTIRAFIYLETNNIDIIILVSIIFLIVYQFI